jgi:ActR/RegA family two-component response regulator
MPKRSLVSVVEDDQFFRESMRRLMRSLGYGVEAFASAADFLASPRARPLRQTIRPANSRRPSGDMTSARRSAWFCLSCCRER